MRKYAVVSFAAALVFAGNLFAQDLAPSRFGDTILHATRTASTGGLSSTGQFTALFTSGGIDYTFSTNGTGFNDDAAAYTYTKTGANTARIAETGVTIDLTFTSTTAGTFVATWTNGTQSGTFTLEDINLTPQFVNISARAPLPAGGSIIPGFVVNGPGTTRVLIRAVGPGLVPLGVTNPVADPKLSVHKGDTVIATNDNWDAEVEAGASLAAAFTAVGAFELAAGSKDAAVILTLEPGVYTAVASSVDGTSTGEVLVEVYALP